ncbi:MAG: hypothetical protein JXB13_09140 [Phycisphaerae bacterium]|nr:hypothetical protein [Phycisphaerae bacterium]
MRTLMLVLLAGLAGCGDVKTDWACGTEGSPPPQVTVMRVLECWSEEEGGKPRCGLGAGLPISSEGIITYKHDLPPNVMHVYVEGEAAPVLDRGSEDADWDDWVYVRFQSAPDQIPMLDPNVQLRPGERVAMVGFPVHGIPKDRLKEWQDIPPRTIYGRIVSKPFWLGIPDEVVFIKPDEGALKGMSGGPAMVLRDNKWVVFGVMVGKVRQDILNGFFSSKLFYARRIPEHLLQK